MGEVLTITGENRAKKASVQKYSYYSEDPRAQFLLVGTDERGKPVYFFQMNITGLRQRVFGPYSTRSTAIHSFDVVLGKALEAFCEVLNNNDLKGNKGNNGMEHVALPDDLQVCR
jgi:hypothetical protein